MSRRWRGAYGPRRGRTFRVIPVSLQSVSPVGIASAETFGVPFVNDGLVRPAGIASAEAVGTPVITTGPVTVSPAGIFSTEAFGVGFVTISYDLTRLVRTARPSTGYELVAIARIPQAGGPPELVEIDPIPWKGLNWVDELSKPQLLNASCSISALTDSVIRRLRQLHELPTELWLYRNGELVFAGPWFGWQVQGETLTIQASGLLGYLRYMIVTSDLVFSQVDQFQIVQGLVDHWQNQPYGNFGIDTSTITTSGMLRDATYKATELHNIGQRVEELGLRINGFDTDIDPTTRALRLWYPTKGTDRSDGPDAIVFDSLSVTSSSVLCSCAPGDVATDAFGTGTGVGDPVYSAYSDPELLPRFGKTGVTGNFDGVSEQSTIDDHVLALQNARDAALLVPGPGVRSTVDADLTAYSIGDTVSYELHARLGINGAFRLRKRSVVVSDTGTEKAALEFV